MMRVIGFIITVLMTVFCSQGGIMTRNLKDAIKDGEDSVANEYLRRGQYKEAYECCLRQLESSKEEEQIRLFQEIAYLSSRLGRYDDAIAWQQKAVASIIEVAPNTIEYALALDALARYNSRASLYDEAIRVGEQVVNLIERLEGKHARYAECLNNLAHYWYKKGEIGKAMEYAEIANPILAKEVPQTMAHISGIKNLAQYMSRIGRYDKAIALCTEAKESMKSLLRTDHPDYANILSSLSTYYSRTGEYVQATQIENEALGIRRRVLGQEHPDYATSLSHLAHYSYKLGNIKDAIRYGKAALGIREKQLSESHTDYVESLTDLSKYYVASDSVDSAIQIGEKSLRLRGGIFGEDNLDYANAVSNIAYLYSCSGDNVKALDYEKKASKIREAKLTNTHPDYAKSLYRISAYHYKLNHLDSAYAIGRQSLDTYRKAISDHHPDVISCLMNLSEICMCLGNHEEAMEYASIATKESIQRIKHGFQSLPTSERNHLWKVNHEWFELKLPMFGFNNDEAKLTSLVYDGVLFSKGVLLNSEMEFEKFLADTGDPKLLQTYRNLKEIRSRLDKLYEKPIFERIVDVDSLERQANELEKKLMLESTEFGDYTRNLAVTWNDVRSNLKEGEVAIEFVSCRMADDNTFYMAYVLRPDMICPEVVRLFEEKDMKNIELSYDSLYTADYASRLLWEKLDNYIKDAKDVYFAPDGVLHDIAIEYFPDYYGKGMLSDRLNLHRVSSTREIALANTPAVSSDAVVYGGIEYDSDPDVLGCESNRSSSVSKGKRGTRTSFIPGDSTQLRKGNKYLERTLVEALNIDSLMNVKGYESAVLSGKDATEESFKDLAGQRKGIIHISTHGFYYEKEDVANGEGKESLLAFFNQAKDNNRSEEDQALIRTGLYMAGSNNILLGKNIPEDVEDGLLTAQEIANLDLRGLDLVGLSACQTGKGDIGPDGVFGLQRGFKKAGANTILMSLWDVDDEATQILMTEFYRHYLNGKTKREALSEAQKTLRMDTKWQRPEYWAAFILLDALN